VNQNGDVLDLRCESIDAIRRWLKNADELPQISLPPDRFPAARMYRAVWPGWATNWVTGAYSAGRDGSAGVVGSAFVAGRDGGSAYTLADVSLEVDLDDMRCPPTEIELDSFTAGLRWAM
jgi:hypothetical protein